MDQMAEVAVSIQAFLGRYRNCCSLASLLLTAGRTMRRAPYVLLLRSDCEREASGSPAETMMTV